MYRLHNNSIEAKVDWLVMNEHLLERRIVISPWDADGIQCYRYLSEKWGSDATIIDDEVAKFNSRVISFDKLDNCNEYVYLLLGARGMALIGELHNQSVCDESIFVLRGDPLRAQDAIIKCMELPNVKDVLDVGCGKGNHSKIFVRYGKNVTGIESGFAGTHGCGDFKIIEDDFEKHAFEQQYDLVWCSHVLEHQLNVEMFIKKLFACCKKDGYVAITVPDESDGMIVEGHVSFWNVGQLLNNIIHCGQSCRHAMAKRYSGNISVIVPNEPFDLEVDYRAEICQPSCQ
jgi:SAM-dependent methyltransferase